jgi:hypothetical protein
MAVEGDDMPAARIEAVVAAPARAGSLAKIAVVAVRAAAIVFVVAGRGPGDGLETPPGGMVAAREFGDEALG